MERLPFAFFPERPPDGEGGRRGFVAPDAFRLYGRERAGEDRDLL